MQTINTYKAMKKKGEKIAMITAYDYPSGKFVEEAQVDIILIGDSLGMVVLGYEDTLQVSVEDIIHHCKATRRGAKNTFIVADMPFMSYHLSLEETKRNAARLIIEGNANAVKLEGGSSSRIEAIKAIVDCEIPVIAHLGLTPQSVLQMGGYKIQGKRESNYIKILEQAKSIEKAGAFMLVLEGIPEKLGKEISETLLIPTIGIGAGRFTDGQVLVYHDLLGMFDEPPKFVKVYRKMNKEIIDNVKTYVNEVKSNKFPTKQHVYFVHEK